MNETPVQSVNTPKALPQNEKARTLLDYCLEWIKKIKLDKDKLDTESQTAMRFWESDPSIVKLIEGRSQVTTTDMFDVVEGVKADLLEIFAGSNQICSFTPETGDDVIPVKQHELLLNKQLRQKNPWFTIVHDVLDELLRLRFGGIQWSFERKTVTIEREFVDLNDEEFQMQMMEIQKTGWQMTEHNQEELTPATLAPDGFSMIPPTFKHSFICTKDTEEEGPRLYVFPSEDCGFPIDTRDAKSCSFFYLKRRYNKWSFIDEYGQKAYDLVKELKGVSNPDYDSSDETFQQRFADLDGFNFFYDAKKDEFIVYECQFRHPDNGKWWIYTFCGDVELRSLKSKYGRLNAEFATAFKLAHRMIGKGYYNILRETQRQRTALRRQIYDNLSQSNFRRYFGDPTRVNMKDYLQNNSTNAFIRTIGDPSSVVMPEQKAPLPPEVFQFDEMLLTERDYHSKFPRSYQGINSRVLNDTFRGQNQQIQQSSKGILMIARMVSEMLFKPLIEACFDMNIRFLQKKTYVRVLNEYVEINPDNIVGKADVTVNVGLGTGNNDMLVSRLQQLIGLMGQALGGGAAFVNQQNMYHVYKELVKAMEFKDVENFVTDPKLKEAFENLLRMVVQMGMSMGMQSPMQLPPPMLQMIMEISRLLGVNLPALIQSMMAPPPGTGASPSPGPGGAGGTFPGQNTPAIPEQPNQPNNPVLTPDGGGFFG